MMKHLFSPIPQSARRAGGRAARRTVRAAPLSEELRPVRAGLAGGQYRPLDDAAVAAIDDAVHQILEEIGLSQAPDTGAAYMTSVGAIAGDDGRVRFPRALVDDMGAFCARRTVFSVVAFATWRCFCGSTLDDAQGEGWGGD